MFWHHLFKFSNVMTVCIGHTLQMKYANDSANTMPYFWPQVYEETDWDRGSILWTISIFETQRQRQITAQSVVLLSSQVQGGIVLMPQYRRALVNHRLSPVQPARNDVWNKQMCTEPRPQWGKWNLGLSVRGCIEAWNDFKSFNIGPLIHSVVYLWQSHSHDLTWAISCHNKQSGVGAVVEQVCQSRLSCGSGRSNCCIICLFPLNISQLPSLVFQE